MSDSDRESDQEVVMQDDDEFDLLEKDESDNSEIEDELLGDTDEVDGYSFASFADAMQKILSVHLSPSISTPVLCKRKLKLTELNETKSKDKLAKQMREEKKQRKEIGHSVPESLSSEKDQLLRKIATKGAVTLFTAIKTYQKKKRLEKKANRKNQDKSKSSINDVLQAVSQQKVNEVTHPNTVKEQTNEKKTKWAVLDENLLANPTLKDWDQQEESEDNWSEDE